MRLRGDKQWISVRVLGRGRTGIQELWVGVRVCYVRSGEVVPLREKWDEPEYEYPVVQKEGKDVSTLEHDRVNYQNSDSTSPSLLFPSPSSSWKIEVNTDSSVL